MSVLQIPVALARTYGVRGFLRRAVHETRKAAGWYKARPQSHPIRSAESARGVSYHAVGDWSRLPPDELRQIIERGARVVGGAYQAYGDEWRTWPDLPEQWRVHPRTGFVFPMVEWWRVPLLPPGSDVKDIWEPGRFAWVYDLIRAHLATGEPVYARTFHQRLAGWLAANPPFQGPQWACGQETAIRALAVLHAEAMLPAANDTERDRIQFVLCASGERIADAIGYGLSQRNNHGISESAGLIHLGLRLRGTHGRAHTWLAHGTRLLDEQVRDQFARDGWYAQHSFNYMRVALDQALYAQRALLSTGAGLSQASLERLDAAIDLMAWLVEAGTGSLPNHGANDGARVLPLSPALQQDFRPLLTLAALIRGRPIPADIRPDPFVHRWLGGDLPPSGLARTDGVISGESGWAAARVGACVGFLRAPRYRHRPSHIDVLHLDVRFGEREVIADAGTYSYNAPPPWQNGLAAAMVHNGPIVGGSEEPRRASRFLWLSWPHAQVLAAELGAQGARLVAERAGIACREVLLEAHRVRVHDEALAPHASSMQVTWLLHPDNLACAEVEAADSVRLEARENDVTGWYSPTYGRRVPSVAVRISRTMHHDARTIDTTICCREGCVTASSQ